MLWKTAIKCEKPKNEEWQLQIWLCWSLHRFTAGVDTCLNWWPYILSSETWARAATRNVIQFPQVTILSLIYSFSQHKTYCRHFCIADSGRVWWVRGRQGEAGEILNVLEEGKNECRFIPTKNWWSALWTILSKDIPTKYCYSQF